MCFSCLSFLHNLTSSTFVLIVQDNDFDGVSWDKVRFQPVEQNWSELVAATSNAREEATQAAEALLAEAQAAILPTCPRVVEWCADDGGKYYSEVDCNGDGTLDRVCDTFGSSYVGGAARYGGFC